MSMLLQEGQTWGWRCQFELEWSVGFAGGDAYRGAFLCSCLRACFNLLGGFWFEVFFFEERREL